MREGRLPEGLRANAVAGVKQCRRCGNVKPLSDFGLRRGNVDGLQTQCRPCLNAYVRALPKGTRAAYSRKYRGRHGDKVKQGFVAYKKTPEGRARLLLSNCRKSARRKGFAFDLDAEDIVRRVSAGHCEATGIAFEFSGARNPWQPSIDRINTKLGYVQGNVRIVAWIFNAACNIWGEEPLRRLALALTTRGSS